MSRNKWYTYTDEMGQRWQVNPTGVTAILRAFAHMTAVVGENKVNFEEREYSIPGYWQNCPPGAIRNTMNARYGMVWQAYSRMMRHNGGAAWNFLVGLRAETAKLRLRYTQIAADIDARNQQYIALTDLALRIAKGVRNTGFIVLTLYGGAYAGVPAVIAAGVGIAGQGASTYQDTGNIKKAAIESGGTLITLGWAKLASPAYTKDLGTGVKGILVGMGVVLDFTFQATAESMVKDGTSDPMKKAAIKTLQNLVGYGIGSAATMEVEAGVARLATEVHLDDELAQFAAQSGYSSVVSMASALSSPPTNRKGPISVKGPGIYYTAHAKGKVATRYDDEHAFRQVQP